MKKIFLFSLSILALSNFAAYKGQVHFSSNQINTHQRSISQLVKISENCLKRHKQEHLNFYQSNCQTYSNGQRVCLSKFYGERRYSMTRGARRSDGQPLQYLPDALRQAGFNPAYASQMKTTSCVGLALQCLKEGFQQTNQEYTWNQVMHFVRSNGVGGTALQHALSKLGWTTFYWNPSPLEDLAANAQSWDLEEKNWPSKGWHLYRYQRIQSRGTYWFNNVDDAYAMVGFGAGSPRRLESIPFWVGTAHTGYHVFPGTRSEVVEAHSTRDITSRDNIEFSRFAPFQNGGGPRWTRTEKYRSGLIVVPPTY